MLEDRFLYCQKCNEAHRLTPFDRAPLYNPQDSGVEETCIDDRRQFVDRHTGHKMEELVAVKYHYISRPMDPMKVSYVEVTDGRESFMLRACRKTIADALSYKMVPMLRAKAGEIVTKRKTLARVPRSAMIAPKTPGCLLFD